MLLTAIVIICYIFFLICSFVALYFYTSFINTFQQRYNIFTVGQTPQDRFYLVPSQSLALIQTEIMKNQMNGIENIIWIGCPIGISFIKNEKRKLMVFSIFSLSLLFLSLFVYPVPVLIIPFSVLLVIESCFVIYFYFKDKYKLELVYVISNYRVFLAGNDPKIKHGQLFYWNLSDISSMRYRQVEENIGTVSFNLFDELVEPSFSHINEPHVIISTIYYLLNLNENHQNQTDFHYPKNNNVFFNNQYLSQTLVFPVNQRQDSTTTSYETYENSELSNNDNQ
ncbi:hypothetical protein M0811_00411 [Anaeramoeba ignava]|uniref:Transmembrane protein n=1 Tax=Anaeramoeba ignava TaxID=1746090 RepID=A0A9Q0LP20_ANAIG|nr:hypothetical protein M0811_00411 [Anaeramoeba ignava]